MKGWIYVFSNRSMPGLIKIGYTDRDPAIRVGEQHSGLPFPHDLEYEILVDNAYNLEQKIHKKLRQYNESKEWFKIDIDEAVSIIKEIAQDRIHLENFYKADRVKAEELLKEREVKREEEIRKKEELEKKKKIFELERNKIIKSYDDKLNDFKLKQSASDKFIWGPLGTVFLLFMMSLGIFSIIDDGDVFWSMIWILFWVGIFFMDKREKEESKVNSQGYKEIVRQREKEIEEIKNKIFKFR